MLSNDKYSSLLRKSVIYRQKSFITFGPGERRGLAQNVVMLSVVMLSVVMLSVVMLSIVMLIVVAPLILFFRKLQFVTSQRETD